MTIRTFLESTRVEREELYKHFHRHPELSMQEYETAKRIVEELQKSGITPIRIGRTGVAVVIENGKGSTVGLRGDIDALPIKEASGKDYASTMVTTDETTGQETPVMHACGHDMHLMSLLTALRYFNEHREQWSGTIVGVFQPGEETAEGARQMVEDGLIDAVPTPEVYLGQHVMAFVPVGMTATKPGALLSTARSITVGITGKGTHGSMPNLGVDPVIVASEIVGALQTIVSREVAPTETSVVTVGAIHAGSKHNVISDYAELKINTRAYSEEVSDHISAAVERIIRGICQAHGCPKEPTFEYRDHFPLTSNHEDATAKVTEALSTTYSGGFVEAEPVGGSEDFSIIADAFGAPYCFWFLGGFDELEGKVGNHSPTFAPDLQPTLDRGAEALIVAANAWVGR